MEVDDQENEIILVRLAATTKDPTNETCDGLANPRLTKYTNAEMPDIQDDAPMALLEGISKEQLMVWLKTVTGKVLTRPFNTEVGFQPNHLEITKSLIVAANKITGQSNVAVSPPMRDKKASEGRKRSITFLIHNLSPNGVLTLLSRKVWSSVDISFQVSPINAEKPDFLFTLNGIIAPDPVHVENVLAKAWRDQVTIAFVNTIIQQANTWEQHQLSIEIDNFLNSATVTELTIKTRGGKDDPHYNVYADGSALKSDQTWLEFRDFLKARVYSSPLYGRGTARKYPFICSLCHGCDHPRGLCPFPKISGWNGGKRNSNPPNPPNADVTNPSQGPQEMNRPANTLRYNQVGGTAARNFPRKSI